MTRSLLPLISVALACAACDPSGTASDQAGLQNATFSVSFVNDSSVPRLSPYNSCLLLQDGGRLTLYANGQFTMSLNGGTEICNGTPQGSQGYGGSGTYELADRRITFHFPWGDMHGDYAPGNGGQNVQQPFITLNVEGNGGTTKYVLAQVPEELH